MKKNIILFLAVLVLLIIIGIGIKQNIEQTDTIVQENSSGNYLFYGNGCAHCAKVSRYFQKNGTLEKHGIKEKNISGNAKYSSEFNEICQNSGFPLDKRGIPMLYFEGQCLMGDQPIIDFFENGEFQNPGNKQDNNLERNQTAVTIPIVISGALVDAINPCEFAVLILLLTTILATGNRKRSLQAGLAFSTSMFISYYLMGLGLYGVVATTGLSTTFMKIIGVLAILVGLFNLKDYFWYGKGFVMEVPMSWRPKLKKIIGSITSPTGAFFTGFFLLFFPVPYRAAIDIFLFHVLTII